MFYLLIAFFLFMSESQLFGQYLAESQFRYEFYVTFKSNIDLNEIFFSFDKHLTDIWSDLWNDKSVNASEAETRWPDIVDPSAGHESEPNQ